MFIFVQSLPGLSRWTCMLLHVSVTAHTGKLFFCQMQIAREWKPQAQRNPPREMFSTKYLHEQQTRHNLGYSYGHGYQL